MNTTDVKFTFCVLATFGVMSCANPAAIGTCIDDNTCGAGTVCAFGFCVNANDPRLGAVDIEIEPLMSSGLPVQSVFDIDAREVDDDRVVIGLKRGVSLRGTIVNDVDACVEPQAKPCVSHSALPALVQARPTQSILGRVRAPATTTDGNFQLLAVADETYRLSATPEDTAVPPFFDDSEFIDQNVLLIDGGNVRVQGRVVAGVGVEATPVQDVEVLITFEGRRVSSLVRTAADGSFVIALRRLISAAILEVRSSAANSGFPSITISVDIDNPAVDLGDISLGAVSAPVGVHGTVSDRSGAPARGASVNFRGLVGAGIFTARATANELGVFELQVLRGDYLAAVVAVEDDRAGLLVQAVRVEGELDDLRLSLPSRLDASVRVTTHEGVPVAAASVILQRVGDIDGLAEPVLAGAQPVFFSFTDGVGNATLAVDGGRYRVTLQPPRDSGAPAFSALVTVDGTFVRDFVLPEKYLLAGLVNDNDGLAAPGSFVRVFSKLTDEVGQAIFLGEAIAGDDGSFAVSVPNLSP